MSKIPNFKVWTYMSDDRIKAYDYENQTFKVMNKPPSGINSYYVTSGFVRFLYKTDILQKKNKKRNDLVEAGLYDTYIEDTMIAYCDKLIEDRNQILNYTGLLIKFDYFDNKMVRKSDGETYYRNHTTNVTNFFKRLCRNSRTDRRFKYADFDPIDAREYGWFKKCNNAGLTYLREPGLYENCYGYDFSMSYPSDMAKKDFQVPTTKGRECIITDFEKVNRVVKYGIYRVKIQCNDPNFKQVFGFSKKHYYTHWSIQFALSNQKKFDVSIEIIKDKKPNALIYDDLISGMSLFGCWYNRLKEMKQDLKGNLCLKTLYSSAWGHINAVRSIYKTEKEYFEMKDEGYTFSYDYDDIDHDYIIIDRKCIGKSTERYELLDTTQSVYKMPIRLLSFITSFSRYKMAKLITKNDLFDSVIRIQTDGIVFDKPLTIKIDGFDPEDKTTGTIQFDHVNKYEVFE